MGKMPMLRGTGVSPVLGQTSGLAWSSLQERGRHGENALLYIVLLAGQRGIVTANVQTPFIISGMGIHRSGGGWAATLIGIQSTISAN